MLAVDWCLQLGYGIDSPIILTTSGQVELNGLRESGFPCAQRIPPILKWCQMIPRILPASGFPQVIDQTAPRAHSKRFPSLINLIQTIKTIENAACNIRHKKERGMFKILLFENSVCFQGTDFRANEYKWLHLWERIRELTKRTAEEVGARAEVPLETWAPKCSEKQNNGGVRTSVRDRASYTIALDKTNWRYQMKLGEREYFWNFAFPNLADKARRTGTGRTGYRPALGIREWNWDLREKFS